MKNKYIQLGVVAAIFICMLGAFLLLQNTPAETEPESSSAETIFVVGGEPAFTPVQIDVKNESGSYSIVGSASDDFIIKGWDKLSLDSYALGQAKTTAGAMEAKLVVTENAENTVLADYGLDKPRADAKISYDNGSAQILIGADAPGGEGVYVKRDGDNTVYLVSTSTVDVFLKPDVAYINKAITETDAEFKGFDKITLSGTNYPEPIVIARTPESTIEAGGMTFNTHSLTSPVKTLVDSQRGLDPLTTVYGLNATDVLAVIDDKTETLEKYGLAEPAAVISVAGPADAPDLSFELRVSAPDGDGHVNIIKTGSPVLYELAASSLPWLPLTLFDYMEKSVIMPNITDVSSVKLSAPGQNYEFTMTGEGDDLTVSLNGAELPEVVKADGSKATGGQNFRQFYQTMLAARYDAPTDERPPEGVVPLAQIEYRYKGGKAPDVVTFYPGPTRRAFASLNDGTPYLCELAYVDRLIEDAVKIAAGATVKSYF